MATRVTLQQQRAQETRRRIIEAAERVFGREGYGQAAVDDILAEADISRGAFYHHFGNKEEVFKALLDDHLSAEVVEMSEMSHASSFRELIERFVAYHLKHIESELGSGALSLEFFAAATRDEAIQGPVAQFHGRMREFLRSTLETGKARGAVRGDLDAEAAAFLFQALFDGSALLLAIEPEALDVDRLHRPLSDLIERFVRPEGDPR